MYKCFVCDKKLNKDYMNHIKSCSKNKNMNLNKTQMKIKFFEYNYKMKISKKFMKENYIKKELSLPDFKKYFNFPYKLTLELLDYFDIEKRSIEISNKLNKRQEKTKKTWIEKYGTDNVSKLEIIKEKKKETFINNYGVDNISKSKEFKQTFKDKFENEKRITKQGYAVLFKYDHPQKNFHNHVFEHRFVMEQKIGRLLLNSEVVHHIDGDKTNNNIDNLYLCKNSNEHGEIHSSLQKLGFELLKKGIIKFKDGEYTI